MTDPRNVFVVHGRDDEARSAMFALLRALDLKPLGWETIVTHTGQASPYLGDVVATGFTIAQAVVVLLTPDDTVELHPDMRGEREPDYETRPTGQARPNVIYEAGMAMGMHRDRTLIVEIGRLRPFADIGGLNVVRMNGTVQALHKIAQRLKIAGCPVDDSDSDWLNVARFTGLSAYTREP